MSDDALERKGDRTWMPPVIIARLAKLCLEFRRHQDNRRPREIHLAPLVYRQWRETAPADPERFFDVPIRCSERMPHGFDMIATS